MPRYSAKQRQMRGHGKKGPPHAQLPWHVIRSTAYHGLSTTARALLIELVYRYRGANNGMIGLGVREAAYELRCNQGTVSRAFRELDDAGLARPMKVGVWRGRRAEEYRLMWKRCDQTQELPRTNWPQQVPYSELPPKRKPKPCLTNAERQKRWRDRQRNENRNDELHQESAQVALGEHGRYASCARRAQNRNSSINVTEPSNATKAHIHIYQKQGRDDGGEE
jgi:hypothetical protein